VKTIDNFKSIDISVVSPVYGCHDCLVELINQLTDVLSALKDSSFEIILVEDGSPDSSWGLMKELANQHKQVIAIKLSRNFGQHAAIQAGLSLARGKKVIVMDCDLQDQPSEIPRLLEKANEGYDVVLAKREERTDGWLKRKTSAWFYRVLSYLTETQIDPSVANFGVYDQKVVKAILEMGDYVRFFPSMVSWVGFTKTTVEIQHGKREAGLSSYSMGKLIRLGLNVILSFSDKPLRLMVKFGFLVTGLVVIGGLITFVQYLSGEIDVLGYTSLILSVWFLGGLVISLIGLVGLYVGKTFDQAKSRPVFIISEHISHDSGTSGMG
jgi:glycosyltransferase involved in cell wall biosynthesis